MATSIVELERWMSAQHEDEHLEFKEAKNTYDDDDLCRYCVALANEGGGKFVLGVTDRLPRQVVGSNAYRDPAKAVQSILERVRFRVDVEVVDHPDGRVLVFHVPSRPKGTAYSLRGAYWMRSMDRIVAMTDDQLRRIHDESKADWELRPALSEGTADDVVRLLDTQGCFDLMDIAYPSTRQAVLDRLASWNLVQPTGSRWIVTNLGAILFAKRLDDFSDLGRKAPRVVVYDGPGKFSTTLRDETHSRGYGTGFEDLVAFINGQIPANEVIGQALRVERRMYPEIAIRELVANALVHQDFLESGTGMMVEVYSDRMEISSPGRPFIDPERFIDEYQSRNEKLAEFMRWLGICEEKGSGIDKVINAVEAYQLPPPDFRAGEHRTVSVLFSHQDFDQMDREDRIRACYQHCVLRWCMNQKMSNQSLRERFGLQSRPAGVVSPIIAAALEQGRIKPADPEKSSKKYARYLPFWA